MPGTPFSAAARAEGGGTVIDLHGDIDRNAQEQLESVFGQTGDGPVILNFSDVDYINSTGIAVIVGILARARAQGRPLRACGLSDHYREIFHITRLSDFMAIFDDELAALASKPT
jgi:anti-anti-sigma factor